MLGYPSTSNLVVQITRGTQTVRQLTYDTGGNLATDSVGNAYTYNKRNRLAVATVGALVFNYTYNALEQLAIRSVVSPASTTHFIHDRLGNVIAETAGGGPTGATGTVREYIWLPESEIAPTSGSRTSVDRPLAVVDAVNTTPVTYWVSVDHLNRPVLLTNATKLPVWTAVWQPWGGVQTITGTFTLNERLPGQWFQSETGLHYNWHRHYDPTLDRYTQPDPLGFVDGPSVYGYAGASPYQWVDNDGRFYGVVIQVLGRYVIIPIGQRAITAITAAIIAAAAQSGDTIQPPPPPPPGGDEGDCPRWDCKMADKEILKLANIDDAHAFKSDHDAKPNSRFDIFSCTNGAIVIRARGQCGRSGPTISTYARWK